MIAVDTNIVLRRLLGDDDRQVARARKLFEMEQRVLITDVVLVETIRTLRGKRYNAQRDDIIAVVASLLEEPNVIFEDQQAVWSALNEYAAARSVKTANGNKTVDFADALIVYKAQACAKELGEEIEAVYTFDQAALEITGMKVP
ncbi:MAG: type II toxin-antitoxin system VapC family toxin [Gammaproteobacteria bacterium]|nr:type II toxin-antitoxin system VapC family toxin [Gammaproteobacteria bacterium]